MKIKLSNIDKAFTIFVSLLPFLYQYKSPINTVSFGEFILIPFLLFYTIYIKKIDMTNYNYYFLYLFFILLTSIFAMFQSYFSIGSFFSIFMRMVFYTLLIYHSYDKYDFKLAMKLIINLSILFCIYAFIQYFVQLTSGRVLPTVINKSFVFSPESGGRLSYETYYRWLYRASSLFLEPSYFVFYIAPALCGVLFLDNIDNRLVKSILISVGALISSSSAGLIILLLVWGIYIVNNFFDEEFTLKRLLLIFSVIIGLVVLFSSSISDTVLERTKSGGSFNNRVLRTVILTSKVNIYQFLFGVGLNNVSNFCDAYSIHTPYDEDSLDYVSSYVGTLLTSGVFTFIAYNLFLVKSFLKEKHLFNRVLVLIFIFMLIIGNNFFNSRFGYYVTLIISFQKYIKNSGEC